MAVAAEKLANVVIDEVTTFLYIQCKTHEKSMTKGLLNMNAKSCDVIIIRLQDTDTGKITMNITIINYLFFESRFG
jgi:hypothetical protein